MLFNCKLYDSTGTTIAGLTVELAFRVPIRIPACKYTFTVFIFKRGEKKRVYQLEVIPPEERGHNGDGDPCYGPHHHIGNKVEAVRVENLGCKHHEAWFRFFLDTANISFGGRYFGPQDGNLFNDL